MFYTDWSDPVEYKNKLIVALSQPRVISMLHHCLHNISTLRRVNFLAIVVFSSALKCLNLWRT